METATCTKCGYVGPLDAFSVDKQKRNGRTSWCKACRSRAIYDKLYPYRVYKKDVCECCGFVPVHSCQLDVDHRDGNRKNNDPGNLQTLCANCHRLKTFLNRDSMNRYDSKGYITRS